MLSSGLHQVFAPFSGVSVAEEATAGAALMCERKRGEERTALAVGLALWVRDRVFAYPNAALTEWQAERWHLLSSLCYCKHTSLPAAVNYPSLWWIFDSSTDIQPDPALPTCMFFIFAEEH